MRRSPGQSNSQRECCRRVTEVLNGQTVLHEGRSTIRSPHRASALPDPGGCAEESEARGHGEIAPSLTREVDAILTMWAPADLIVRDSIGLSITELDTLTNANAPPVGSRRGQHVNKTIPTEKTPSYRETREYVSSDQDGRYKLIYRDNRVAFQERHA